MISMVAGLEPLRHWIVLVAVVLAACAPVRPPERPRRRPITPPVEAPATTPDKDKDKDKSKKPKTQASNHSGGVQRLELPNGIRVILQPSRASSLVAVQAWIGSGAADDPDGQEGLAHFFEHMLFKGTATRAVGAIAREIERAGGDTNAWTTHDQTVFHVVIPASESATAIDVLADALQNSSFDPGELERERTVILDELRRAEENPTRRLTSALFAHALAPHPYARPIVGTRASVKAITRQHLLDFFHQHYVASNLAIVVTGNFDPLAMQKLLSEHFSALPTGRARPERESRPPKSHTQPRAFVEERGSSTIRIGLAFPGVTLADDDAAALDLLAVLLAQSDSSRLIRHLRDDEELATWVDAYSHTPREPGLIVAQAELGGTQITAAVRELSEELFRLRYDEVSPVELERARTMLEASAVYQRETVQGLARKLGTFEILAGSVERELAYRAALAAVTPATLREIAEYYLDPAQATLVVQGGKKLDVTADKLQKIVSDAALTAEQRYAAAPRPTGKPAVQPVVASDRGVWRAEFPSGLKLLILPDHSVGVVAARALWPTGQRYEDESTAGLHHLLAALIARGTRSRTPEQIAYELDAIAGSLRGIAGQNSFSVELEVLSRNWERGFDLFADCLLHPRFAEGEVDRERRLLLGSLAAAEEQPYRRAMRALREALYPTHPYRFDLDGAESAISTINRRRISDFYRDRMTPDQMVLAVVGDVEPADVIRKVRALLEDEPAPRRRPTASTPKNVAPIAAPVERTVTTERTQAIVALGFHATRFASGDRAALEIAVAVLGGQGGRLFVELRDREALGYDVGAALVEGVDPGYIVLHAATSPARIADAKKALEREVERLRTAPITPAELERARRFLIGDQAVRLQRRTALASSLAFHEAIGLGWDEHERYPERLAKVTPADVLAAAQRYLDPAHEVAVIERPDPNPPKIAAPPGPRTSKNLKHPASKSKSKPKAKSAKR